MNPGQHHQQHGWICISYTPCSCTAAVLSSVSLWTDTTSRKTHRNKTCVVDDWPWCLWCLSFVFSPRAKYSRQCSGLFVFFITLNIEERPCKIFQFQTWTFFPNRDFFKVLVLKFWHYCTNSLEPWRSFVQTHSMWGGTVGINYISFYQNSKTHKKCHEFATSHTTQKIYTQGLWVAMVC